MKAAPRVQLCVGSPLSRLIYAWEPKICSALHMGNLWSWEIPGWTNLKAQTHKSIKEKIQMTMGTRKSVPLQ